jgi:ankyrin repeat protein
MPLLDSERKMLPASISPTRRSPASIPAQEPPALPSTTAAPATPAQAAAPDPPAGPVPPARQNPSAALVPTRRAPPARLPAPAFAHPLTDAYLQRLARCMDESTAHKLDNRRLHRFLTDSRKAHYSVEGAMQRRDQVRTAADAAPLLDRLYQALRDHTVDARWTHPLNGWNHMHVAAAAGDVRLARLLIAAGVPSSQPDRAGMTPLHLAAFNGSAESVELLLEHRAHPDAPDDFGVRLLHLAAWSGDSATVTAVLRARQGEGVLANVDAQEPEFGWTPLHSAASQRNHEVVRLLIAAGANPLIRAHDGRSALEVLRDETPLAARRNPAHLQVCEALEKAGEVAQARAALASTAQASTAQASEAQPSTAQASMAQASMAQASAAQAPAARRLRPAQTGAARHGLSLSRSPSV